MSRKCFPVTYAVCDIIFNKTELLHSCLKYAKVKVSCERNLMLCFIRPSTFFVYGASHHKRPRWDFS